MKKMWIILSVIFGSVLLDQLTKGILLYLITGTVPVSGSAWSVVPVPYLMTQLSDFFNIVFTWNPGASFSMFRALGESAPFVIVLATSAIIGCILYYLFARAKIYERIPLALISGGALGNLIDRIRFGAVIDFLDFHIGGWHWPAFNMADIFITVGIGWYLLNMYLAHRQCLKATKGEK